MTSFITKAAAIGAAAVLFSAPAIAGAATYGYINTADELRTMTATSAMVALATAPGIHMHSGVIWLAD